jgi:hypothetical protein
MHVHILIDTCVLFDKDTKKEEQSMDHKVVVSHTYEDEWRIKFCFQEQVIQVIHVPASNMIP